MTLQIMLVVFVLCLTLFCLTSEAPGGESDTGEPSQSRRVLFNYSPQEDEFIIKEAQDQTQINERISWTKMAEQHECKVNSKDFGFYKKRSAQNLRHHFDQLKHDLPDWKTRKTSHRHAYTKQEEDLINKELLDDSFSSYSLYDDGVWETILEKHNRKREQNCEGFSTERSSGGLRYHFRRDMRPGKRVSKEVITRFSRYFKSSQEGNVSWAEDVLLDDDTDPGEDAISDIMEDVECSQDISTTGEPSRIRGKKWGSYSPQEDKFIIKEVLLQTQNTGKISWTMMADLHECKVKKKELGFEKKRSGDNLRVHFNHYLRHKIAASKARKTLHKHTYTEEEEEFINKELLNDSFKFGFLRGDEIWKTILNKHNLKREQNCEGFSKERSAGGLRNHFLYTMRPGGRVPKEVKANFPNFFKKQEGGSSSNVNSDEGIRLDYDTDSGKDTMQGQEEYEAYEDIMKELGSSQNIVDSDGIDHSLFVDKGFSSTDWQNDL